MPRVAPQNSRLCRHLTKWLASLLLVMAATARGMPETNATVKISSTIITNLAQYWQISAVPEERGQLHRARLDLDFYYCDTNWNVFWGISDGLDAFLPIRGIPRSFNLGDRVHFDGLVLPVNQEFLWDKTSISLVSTSNPVHALPTAGHLMDAGTWNDHYVEIEALVDSSEQNPPGLLTVHLLAGTIGLTAYVHSETPFEPLPNIIGKTVRIRGIYSPSFDSLANVTKLTLWTPGTNQIQIVGAMEDDSRFTAPVISSEQFDSADTNLLVRVAGVVHEQRPGESVTIWDDEGQILVLCQQQRPLQLGDHIEAVGYPEVRGVDRILRNGLFRVIGTEERSNSDSPETGAILPLAEQVRGLDEEALTQHPRVRLNGLVTCVSPRKRLVFVQDSSGGIRVMQISLQSGRPIQAGMLVSVEGEATVGEFAPVITNATIRQTGQMPVPDPPLITFEQALTGTEDGHWIQMRGYLRGVNTLTNALELQLVAPGGEFQARVTKADAAQAVKGSIVLVRGVCVAIANSRRELTGIQILCTTPGAVQVEQLAPEDLFALPQRPLASLRQFNLFNTLNKRVHTSGTVTLQAPGRYLYLQDGENSLLALSEQRDFLQPGDRVEVVGFSGNDNGNFLLRETVYRRLSAGPDPAPTQLAALQAADEDLEGRLVQTQGILLEKVNKPDEMRFLIQGSGHAFEAVLDGAPATFGRQPESGSRLAVTGVYRIQHDESGKPVSFLLNLRGAGDVRVLAPPPWLTLHRLLMGLSGGAPLLVLGLIWTLHTRRKNRELQRAQFELQSARDRLEERVGDRTRELNNEVKARQRALASLSEAQQRLMLASRQAGMAEVATGILHNVGNILNSVNVSATIIAESLQRLRIAKFSKAVELLGEHNSHLTTFLNDDPRGRALPGYLQQLAATMTENENVLNAEVKSLTKQIDHVKAVVTSQQGFARNLGFYETVDPAELMEDALRINQAAYERHHIEVIREFDTCPPFMTDRHKVLQILVNLLSNALQALAAANTPHKRVVLRLLRLGEDRLRFEVSDNGTGIAPEHRDRIFSLGFTTKPNGHGFGLHSGANSAKEMGGHLAAASDGAGLGATFSLELPLTPKAAPPPAASLEYEPAA
jgi:signal transduction histidine kinase